jgi:putative hydrolase of the HAD superfamily
LTAAKLRGVIFDLGSTLIDFKGDYATLIPISIAILADHLIGQGLALQRSVFIEAFRQALHEYHTRRDENHIELTTFAILSDVLRRQTGSTPEEALLRDGLTAMYAVSEAYWVPKAAMNAVLDQLVSAGYRLGLLSNAGDEANVQRLIDKFGIRHYFDPILISAALGIRKPDPRPIEMILNRWGFPASNVVMVGDLLEADILGAQRAGIHQIWLRQGRELGSSAPFEQVQPEAIVNDLAEVPGQIQRWDTKG